MKNLLLIFILINIGCIAHKHESNSKIEPCKENNFGSLVIKNTTESDIYFYYSGLNLNEVFRVFVKAKSTYKIENLKSVESLIDYRIIYKWKTSLTLESTYNLDYIEGIEEGTFKIKECKTSHLSLNKLQKIKK